jgi:hypothetical protein
MKKQLIQLNQAKFKSWTEGKTVEIIDQKYIVLTEKIHLCSKPINIKKLLFLFKDQEFVNRTIIVKKYKDRYSLVVGLKWLQIAKTLNIPITCIVIGEKYNHQRFVKKIGLIEGSLEDIKVPEGTDLLYPVGKVKLAAFLKKHCPNGAKYQKQEKYYLENQVVDKPITVIRNSFDKNSVTVVDEYTRFLVLVKHGVKNIPVKFAVNN